MYTDVNTIQNPHCQWTLLSLIWKAATFTEKHKLDCKCFLLWWHLRAILPKQSKMGYNRQHNVPESFTAKQQSALKSQYGTLKLTTTVEQTRCEAAESVLPVIAECLCTQRDWGYCRFLYISAPCCLCCCVVGLMDSCLQHCWCFFFHLCACVWVCVPSVRNSEGGAHDWC